MISKSPLCIASPVRRSGTTLLQRLLCSSSNTLIYGETCANDINLAVNLLFSKQTMLAQSKQWHKKQLKKVLEGSVNNWIPDLMPDIDGYLLACKDALFSVADHYASFAQSHNRHKWGMKMPEWNPSALTMLQKALPETKIIYLHRNLEDCVRSAKKIEMIIDANEINQFCNIWKQNSAFANFHLKGDNVLHLNYEDLVTNPELWISKIESFSGVEDIDHAVMHAKVNTYSNDNRLVKDEAYLEPASLTQEELSIVKSFVG